MGHMKLMKLKMVVLGALLFLCSQPPLSPSASGALGRSRPAARLWKPGRMTSDELPRARWLVVEAERQVLRQREIVLSLSQQGLPIIGALETLVDLEKALARCQARLRRLEGE